METETEREKTKIGWVKEEQLCGQNKVVERWDVSIRLPT